MEFHEYLTHYTCLKKVDPSLTYDKLRSLEYSVATRIQAGCNSQFSVECRWLEANRPYFNIYPSMAQVLSKINFKFKCKHIVWPPQLDNMPFSIRFSKNATPLCVNETSKPLHSILLVKSDHISIDDTNDLHKGMLILANFGLNEDYQLPETYWLSFPLNEDELLEDIINKYIANSETATSWVSNKATHLRPEQVELNKYYHFLDPILRIAIGLLVLANDPEFCVPDVLSKHKAQFSVSKDPKYIDKAKRNGKFGWTVGESLESIPHIRRPHFGIRYTGIGKSIPKLVPIKGSIVNRNKIQLPQGYQDEL